MLLIRRDPTVSPKNTANLDWLCETPCTVPNLRHVTRPTAVARVMSFGYPFVSTANNNRILFFQLPHASGGPLGGAVNIRREGKKLYIVVEVPPPLPFAPIDVEKQTLAAPSASNKYNLVPIYGPMAKCLVSLASVLRNASTHSSDVDGRSETVPQCGLWLVWHIQGVTGGTDQTSGGCSLC